MEETKLNLNEKKDNIIETRFKVFKAEEKNEIIKEIKEKLFEKGQVILAFTQKEKSNLFEKINIRENESEKTKGFIQAIAQVGISSVASSISKSTSANKSGDLLKSVGEILDYSFLNLEVDKEAKTFNLNYKTSLLSNDNFKKHSISSEGANIVVTEYASIIYEEKLKYKKQLEEEQKQKEENERKRIEKEQKLKAKQEEELRIAEEEKVRKEQEFDDFFAV